MNATVTTRRIILQTGSEVDLMLSFCINKETHSAAQTGGPKDSLHEENRNDEKK